MYLETGTGKTYIAVMLLKHLFGDKVKSLDQSLPSSIAEADGPGDPGGEVKVEREEGEVNLVPLGESEMAAKKRRRLDEQDQ